MTPARRQPGAADRRRQALAPVVFWLPSALLQDGHHFLGWEEGTQIGKEIGKEIGREMGVPQGRSDLLIALVKKRFGPIDLDTQLKLAAANPKQLLAWARNFVDATTLDEVFQNK